MKKKYDHMPFARQLAGQCWCAPEVEDREMDVELAEQFARTLCFWLEETAQGHDNTRYYRDLVVECGKYIGKDSYIQDDGGVCDEVLCAKVPELVKQLAEKVSPSK